MTCQRAEPLPVPDDTLAKVLADVHVAEAAVQNLSGTYKDSLKSAFIAQACSIRQIKLTDLYKSVDMLVQQPDRMEKVYKRVEKRLEALGKAQKSNPALEK